MKRAVAVSWMVRLGLAVALLAMALVAAGPVVPPAPVPESAPHSTFSAQRAMKDLEMVARAPHPVGSSEQERVRGYILAQSQALGLPTEVQKAEVAPGRTAKNLIVRLPGTADGTADTSRDVLITAHYDSAPPSPGAGDAGISVTAMLESMRVLDAGEPLKNDVIFLFTDGEELGGPGAEAFATEHPAAKRVGVAFVFDSEPDSVTTDMRTTSPKDAWLVGQLVEASPPVFADSATNTSDRARLGNDFAAFPPAGITSAEFLLQGSVVRYHTPKDTVGAVHPSAVQDQGDTMLSLVRHFGNLDLTGAVRNAGQDLVFFAVPVFGLVAYPIWLAKALAIAAVVIFVAMVVLARRRRRLSLARLGLGTLAFLAVLVVGATLAWGAWGLLLALHPESASTLHFPDFEGSGVAMAAIYAVAVVAFVAASRLLSRWIGALELAGGALVWLAALSLALALFEPLFSAVAIWPLVGGVAALAVAGFYLRRAWVSGALLALAAVPGPVLIVPLLAFEAIKVEDGAVVGVASLLLLLGSLLLQLLAITGGLVLGAEGRTEPKESTSHKEVLHPSAEGEPLRPSG